ncbi:MAG: hypothetical protein AAFO15_00250 [Pseudomonadota bacterium]
MEGEYNGFNAVVLNVFGANEHIGSSSDAPIEDLLHCNDKGECDRGCDYTSDLQTFIDTKYQIKSQLEVVNISKSACQFHLYDMEANQCWGYIKVYHDKSWTDEFKVDYFNVAAKRINETWINKELMYRHCKGDSYVTIFNKNGNTFKITRPLGT